MAEKKIILLNNWMWLVEFVFSEFILIIVIIFIGITLVWAVRISREFNYKSDKQKLNELSKPENTVKGIIKEGSYTRLSGLHLIQILAASLLVAFLVSLIDSVLR